MTTLEGRARDVVMTTKQNLTPWVCFFSSIEHLKFNYVFFFRKCRMQFISVLSILCK
jgi:hypothetical protein